MTRPPTHVCRNCLSLVIPRTTTPGNDLLTLGLLLLFLVPGVLYGVWRLTARHKVCPVCWQPVLVPLGTPGAALLLASLPSALERKS